MEIDPGKLALFITPVLRLWYYFLFYRQIGYDRVKEYKEKGNASPVLFALWHDELLPPIYIHRNQGILILVSESRDGELISRVLKGFGYNTVRGSSTRGGVKALKQIVQEVKLRPRDLAITVDGPTGPRHKVKEGIIYISWKLNIPIVPVRSRISFKKVFSRSWDRFQLPLPGSMCEIIYGEPYIISCKKINTPILVQETARLEEKMEQLLKQK